MRYKEEDIQMGIAPYDPAADKVYGFYDGQTPYFYTNDGKFHTAPAPNSGANYWLDESGNPLPARDKKDVVMVYDSWKADAAKTLNRLISRQESDEKRLKLWFADDSVPYWNTKAIYGKGGEGATLRKKP